MAGCKIHPTAVVEKGAFIGENVELEPYVVIKKGVALNDGVTVKAHSYIDGNTTIGEGTSIYPSVVIGTQTQDLKFHGETTYVNIGKRCQIREFTTINSSCGEGGAVEVGDDCFIMACCHVAHQCKVGKKVIMSNNSVLAGHVEVEDHVVIGGMTAVHQFVRIGCHAMVGGMSRVTHDIPPYSLGGGTPYKMGGLNLVGLKRRGFSLETRKLLTRCFKLVYRSELKLQDALLKLEKDLEQVPEILHWIDFCSRSKRGLIGLQQVRPEGARGRRELAERSC